MTETTLYERIGGEAGVLRLVGRFYDLMETLAVAKHIRALHKTDLSESRERLYEYYSGWFGGPPLFIEKHGHPRLRARHKHISINTADRDAWLACLLPVLDEMALAPDLKQDLLEKIVPMADHMRNQLEAEPLT